MVMQLWWQLLHTGRLCLQLFDTELSKMLCDLRTCCVVQKAYWAWQIPAVRGSLLLCFQHECSLRSEPV